MKVTVKFVGLFIVLAFLFGISAVIFPVTVSDQSANASSGFGLIVLLVIDLAFLVYLILRLDLSGIRLFLSVVLVFWGLQTFMTQIETWYFREAMPTIDDTELVYLFVRPLITIACFTPLAMWAFNRWKVEQAIKNGAHLKWTRAIGLSIAYVVMYCHRFNLS